MLLAMPKETPYLYLRLVVGSCHLRGEIMGRLNAYLAGIYWGYSTVGPRVISQARLGSKVAVEDQVMLAESFFLFQTSSYLVPETTIRKVGFRHTQNLLGSFSVVSTMISKKEFRQNLS